MKTTYYVHEGIHREILKLKEGSQMIIGDLGNIAFINVVRLQNIKMIMRLVCNGEIREAIYLEDIERKTINKAFRNLRKKLVGG